MNEKLTVHVVMQGHLDPVWLWPWPAGLDEALATGRTACDLLDAYPEFIFTAGEAWRYQQIEEVDPDLFARIRRHVAAGRWELVGGWWIQPDCNFPAGFAIERQISTGKQYLLDHFGTFPEVAYNVDSFGHTATLPGYMHAAGQRFYVMMRPQEHEMGLPARLFRWRGLAAGPEVVTFRIAGSYNTGPTDIPADHIRRAFTELPPGIRHTMCFAGVGDHGGGATAALIEWVRTHAEDAPDYRLVFSSPGRFFQAVSAQVAGLPVVTGELQYHAVGCYSVLRSFKARVRRAEHRLRQAERMVELTGGAAGARTALETAWQRVCFNHFHDTLGGTAIPSAYVAQGDQLGAATAAADELLQHGLRRQMRALPADPLQRIVLFNASEAPYDDYIECEPWTGWRAWQPDWGLVDEANRPVPFQRLPAESVVGAVTRLLFRVPVPPNGLCVLKVAHARPPAVGPAGAKATARSLTADSGAAVTWGARAGLRFPTGLRLPWPELRLLNDLTDTWSHNVDRYAEGPGRAATWGPLAVVDRGPWMASVLQNGRIGQSRLQSEWRVYAGLARIEWRLRIHWCECQKILKAVLPLTGAGAERRDGIPGGSVSRPNSGRESPVQDWTLLDLGRRGRLGVVLPDAYALDATPARVRWTLLRSPYMAHHHPANDIPPRAVVADQGEHEFRFVFVSGDAATPERLAQQALMMQRPLLTADLTRGMPRRWE